MSTPKYVCIHGHFYQPPRENAWLEVVESQDSAAPFHDWNHRITYECYAPNTAARILDEDQRIHRIINNYSRINFNFGPTLLSWLEDNDAETYRAILEADRISQVRYGGHGCAIAQVYSHLIMPLANRRDKETQVVWGIQDFEHRFGRKPEGMWLAETAVDTETLEILAEHDIIYTILAPRQAKAVRQLGKRKWLQLENGSVDPRRAYLCKLPSGREINLFFYDGNVSQGVAFEGLLNNGSAFAERILGTLGSEEEPQLANIATDGESYGHHHRHGEMALASCLEHIQQSGRATLTNYGEYLALYPPQWEAQIHENSSWSCVHGVERWRSNCGCHTGGDPGWTQSWRAPLREALDWLRDELSPIFERASHGLLPDPWATRNAYIDIILDRDEGKVLAFLESASGKELTYAERTTLLRLLEMQRHSMLMYTSCGWFFNEVSGLETNQILQYAYRAIEFARQVADVDLLIEFVERLRQTPSNIYANAAESFQRYVAPKTADLMSVGMHYAVSSLFEEYPEELEFFNYRAYTSDFYRTKAGIQRLAAGRTTVKSLVTLSEKPFQFAVLYLGQQHIIGNIGEKLDEGDFMQMWKEVSEAFQQSDISRVIGVMQHFFGEEKYSIRDLFADEKRKVLRDIAERSLKTAELAFREIYNDTYGLMTSMQQNGIPIPDAYLSAVGHVINRSLLTQFKKEKPNPREIERLNEEKLKWAIQLQDAPGLNLLAGEKVHQYIREWLEMTDEERRELTDFIGQSVEAFSNLGLEPDYWRAQNDFFLLLRQVVEGTLPIVSEEMEADIYRLGTLLRVSTVDFKRELNTD